MSHSAIENDKIDPNGFICLILRLVMLLSSRKGLFMTDNKIEKLGHIVKQARKEQGLTQEQLDTTTFHDKETKVPEGLTLSQSDP